MYTFQDLLQEVHDLPSKPRPSKSKATDFKAAVWSYLCDKQSAFFKAKGLDLDLNSFKTNETVANKINYFLKEVPKYWQAIEGVNLQKVLNKHKAFFTTNIIDFSTEDFKFVNAAQEDVPDPQAPEPMDTNEASSAPTKPPTPFKDYTERHQRRLAKDIRDFAQSPEALVFACEQSLKDDDALNNKAAAKVLSAIKFDQELSEKVLEFIKKPEPLNLPRVDPSTALAFMLERNFSVKDYEVKYHSVTIF